MKCHFAQNEVRTNPFSFALHNAATSSGAPDKKILESDTRRRPPLASRTSIRVR